MNKFKELIKLENKYSKYYSYIFNITYYGCIVVLLFCIGKFIYNNSSLTYNVNIKVNNTEVINISK